MALTTKILTSTHTDNMKDRWIKKQQEKLKNLASGLLEEQAGGGDDENLPDEPWFDSPLTPGEVPEGYAKFSDVFGIKSDSGIEHHIRVYSDEDWPEDIRSFIPEPSSDYVFDALALEQAVLGVNYGENVSISGPPGCGKTSLIKEIAARIRQPYMRLNGKDGLEISSFVGQMVINEQRQTVWQDGLLPIAVKNGFLLAFDEWTKVPAGINMVLQSLLEDGGHLLLEDMPGKYHEKIIHRHDNFRMALCDNVKGLGDGIDKFAATNVQDTSTINRFGVNISMEYLSDLDESMLLRRKYPKLSGKLASHMVAVATKIRVGYAQGNLSLTMSPRNLLKWAKWALILRNKERAFSMAYYQSLSDDSEKLAVDQIYTAVFGGIHESASREPVAWDVPF